MRSAIVFLIVVVVSPSSVFALCDQPNDPDCVKLQARFPNPTFPTNTIDFFATGASFTVNDDGDDRPDRAIEVAEVVVPNRRIPARATLVKAYLYFGGSVFDDEDNITDPDTSVEIQVPGTADYAPVTGDQTYRSGALPVVFSDTTLYTVRADITDIMKNAGGEMVGTYRVRGFDADIFKDVERSQTGDPCSPGVQYNPTTQTCEIEHTAANASFSIILIFEEARLSPRTIVLFDGMQEILGSTVTLDLSGFIVSQVPSGNLTMYAQEGDCNPGPGDCAVGNNLSGLERIHVIGADPARTLVVSDSINPANDVFNRTINTVDPPLTDVPGTDIDAFDITPVLRTGDERVTVEVTSPNATVSTGELIGLVYVVVGIDVFSPELHIDSRIEIATERGEKREEYFPGDPLRVAFAISNTGNMPGSQIRLEADMPKLVTDFIVLEDPENTTSEVDKTGGAEGHGRVVVENISVRHGEVNDLVLLVETECPLLEGGTLNLSGEVSAAREGGIPFTLTATAALAAREICGPRFYLFGGGGCRTISGGLSALSLVPLFFLFALLLLRHRRFRAAFLLLLLFGCGEEDLSNQPDRPPPIPIGVDCPDADGMVVIPSIRGLPAFCIDRYEASVESGHLGNTLQPLDGDGSTTAVAQSVRFTQPAAGITWFQANASCKNAGKRLCSADEWSTACRGDNDLTYPYAEAYQPSTCNGYDATRGATVETGAMIVGLARDDGFFDALGCVTQHGAYDLSGNVWEWNATGYFEDSRRGLVGGSFRSNRTGLRCVTQDNHAAPDESNDAFGFRCCRDL